jgi:hypothetical protein
LHGESDTRGQVTVLSELKVLTQQRTLNYGVVALNLKLACKRMRTLGIILT